MKKLLALLLAALLLVGFGAGAAAELEPGLEEQGRALLAETRAILDTGRFTFTMRYFDPSGQFMASTAYVDRGVNTGTAGAPVYTNPRTAFDAHMPHNDRFLVRRMFGMTERQVRRPEGDFIAFADAGLYYYRELMRNSTQPYNTRIDGVLRDFNFQSAEVVMREGKEYLAVRHSNGGALLYRDGKLEMLEWHFWMGGISVADVELTPTVDESVFEPYGREIPALLVWMEFEFLFYIFAFVNMILRVF